MAPLVALIMVVAGQCPGGVCYPAPAMRVAPAIVRVVEAPCDWHKIKHEDLSFYVWGRKLPNGKVRWNPSSSWNAEQFRLAREAAARGKPAPLNRKPRNFGVEMSKVAHHGMKYTAESEAARQFVERAKARSESSKPRIEAEHRRRSFYTVIGTKDERREASKDWRKSAELRPFRESVWFSEYDANDWQVDPKLGFQPGHPEVVVQRPDGEIVYRADLYPGAGAVAGALRKADPNYDPSKDPPHKTPFPVPDFHLDLEEKDMLLLLLFVIILLIFLPRGNKS